MKVIIIIIVIIVVKFVQLTVHGSVVNKFNRTYKA